MFRKLIDKVRAKGLIDIVDAPCLKDILPVIYNGESSSESPNAIEYFSSGGRSLMFQKGRDIYRIKGVDPYGNLTERVVNSGNNRIKNVADANYIAKLQSGKKADESLFFSFDKPFGPFYFEQALKEKEAFESLEKIYSRLRIQNPCKFLFYKETGMEVRERKTYQTAFKLPFFESDFRVDEFNVLLAERLDLCSKEEITSKSKNINRLYGRFIYWAGVNTAIFGSSGILPVAASFVPQNWVISRFMDGYGIFRVDHTSTKIVDIETSLKTLISQKNGVPAIINEFSIFPSRVQVAANPKDFLSKNKRNCKFSEILFMRRGIIGDEKFVLNAHNNVFKLGVISVMEGLPIDAIPEELFRDALQ